MRDMVGSIESTTVMLKLQVAVLPAESVALQTTGCTPASSTVPASEVDAPPDTPSRV